MIRLAFYLLLAYLLYRLLRRLLKGSTTFSAPERPARRSTAELVRDPQCGAYVLPAQALSARVGGQTYHFCSERCRDQYLELHWGEAGESTPANHEEVNKP